MNITQVELTNFQQHPHLLLNFTTGVNILRGKSAIGKSTVLRAIGWIFGESLAKESIIPWFGNDEEQPTEAKITFDDGVSIKRIISKSINAYEFYAPGAEKPVKTESAKMTEEIRNYLNLPIMTIDKEEILLNVQSQHESHFLLSRPDTFKMKVLNVLTGNDVIDRVAGSFNKDLLAISKDNKQLKELVVTKGSEIENLTKEVTEAEQKFTQVNELFIKAEQLQQKIDKVVQVVNKINTLYNTRNGIQNKLSELKIINIDRIEDYKFLADKFQKVQNTVNKIKELNTKKINIQKQLKDLRFVAIKEDDKLLAEKYNKAVKIVAEIKALQKDKSKLETQIKNTKVVSIDIQGSLGLVDKLNKVTLLVNNLKNSTIKREKLNQDINKIAQEVTILHSKYSELLGNLPNEECKKCPLIALKG